MVVGPEFGPLAGLAVALVEKQRRLAKRSLIALAVGFPLGTLAALLATLAFRAIGVIPEEFDPEQPRPDELHLRSRTSSRSSSPSSPASTGILSLTSTKSGALIGVLVSVTTIPAAANVGVGDRLRSRRTSRPGRPRSSRSTSCRIVVAGVLTLFIQRRLYVRRRRKHLDDPAREEADLPLGRSLRPRTGRRASRARAR